MARIILKHLPRSKLDTLINSTCPATSPPLTNARSLHHQTKIFGQPQTISPGIAATVFVINFNILVE